MRSATTVLGPASTRAVLLGQAQGAIEQAANRWLAELGTDQRIRLTSEGKDLGLEINVGEITKEYTDLSNGEGRRVDLAMSLALGEVAAGARGAVNNGTLFLDEFLDTIDSTSLDAVCALVMRMSRERCVVVITHREDVSSRLRPDLFVVMKA
jgi:DNA repair exonuclease SbcCD ATPase subunit